ncbi:MAG TPA: PfkB family carbohydrate kinase [Candidatus Dormibacteraeota bacterium]|jgi:sugar/nucleoside kinase (ribokinase family)|nr:PfkB family carbohydrate kinase [Candidatus Dormibacteraeota bacterium]
MSLLVVGSVAFDGIETPFGKVEKTLGGAASYFALAASHFTPVRVVGIVGDDFTAREKAILGGRNGRIDLEGLEHASGKSFFWAGRYNQNMNERTTLTTELNVFADFQPKLPKSYLDTSFIFLGNIQPTLQLSVLKQVKRKPVLVGLDSMNYWIERTGSELRETLRHIHVLVINDDETRQLTGEHNLTRAAKDIFKMGPKILVIKRGEHGALLVHRDFLFAVPAFPLEEVHDPTGAGDSFAGGFMGSLARDGRVNEKSLRRAMVYGSVMGSFTCERFGVERLTTLKLSEIKARARHFSKLTSFTL